MYLRFLMKILYFQRKRIGCHLLLAQFSSKKCINRHFWVILTIINAQNIARFSQRVTQIGNGSEKGKCQSLGIRLPAPVRNLDVSRLTANLHLDFQKGESFSWIKDPLSLYIVMYIYTYTNTWAHISISQVSRSYATNQRPEYRQTTGKSTEVVTGEFYFLHHCNGM